MVEKMYEVELASQDFDSISELQAFLECNPELIIEVSSNPQHLKGEEIKDYSFKIETK